VVDDIVALTREQGAGYIFFTDSVFNDREGRYLDVLSEMKRRGICVPWTAFFKPGELDDDAVALMRETGLKAAELGSDAPSDTTLAALGKDFRFRDVVACNELFHRHGVVTAHYFMFGCPGETEATVREGISNIIALRNTAAFVFMGIRILPGTPLASRAEREGLIAPDQDLLDPVYYISPRVDRDWLEQALTEAFEGVRHCVFPPDAMDDSLSFLHKLGYSGSLWEMLCRERRRKPGD
jgi:radical SAM superfamily enzyme YgiQ (UPF0313 family)